MSETYFFSENLEALITEIPPDSIVSRTFYEADRLKAILFGFAPGQELSEHTLSQLAIAWTLTRPVVTSPIIGPRMMEQLEDNLGSLAVEFTADQLAALDKASA